MRSISLTWSVDTLFKLLVQLVEIIEQPRVLDRDDGLRGKILHQLDLLVGEGAHLLAIDGDGTDEFIVFQHRNIQ